MKIQKRIHEDGKHQVDAKSEALYFCKKKKKKFESYIPIQTQFHISYFLYLGAWLFFLRQLILVFLKSEKYVQSKNNNLIIYHTFSNMFQPKWPSSGCLQE
jgi:hypothetical protein